MTMPDDKPRKEPLDRLEDALVEDILAASDEDILAEAKQDGVDPIAAAAAARALFEKAVELTGKAKRGDKV
jgi:hypothetical protein